MAYEGFTVIDGDGHVMEPTDLWSTRMDASKWGDLIPHIDAATGSNLVGGESRGGTPSMARILELTGITQDELMEAMAETRAALGRTGGYDPVARLADMDAAGIDAAVLYASSALFFGPDDPIKALHNPEFVRDCQRAYNDWLAEYCSAAPDRLFGIGAVPLQDIDLAIGEAQRVVGDLGMKGVFVRPSAYIDEQPLSAPVYDRFWAAMQELRVPVAFHPGVHVDTPGACRKFGLVHVDPSTIVTNYASIPERGGSGLGQAVGNAVDMIVTIGRLLMGGVCERFPELEFIFLESGGGWVPTQLERMDEQCEAFRLERRWLSMEPSDYFRRQCYVSFDPGEWNLAASAEYIGPDRILWASDYPHPEYRPDVVSELARSTATLSEDARRKIFGENEARAYRLPSTVSA